MLTGCNSIYECYTTSIIESALENRRIPFPAIKAYDFTSDVLMEYVDFYEKNKELNTIGFNDSSAIFYALKYNIPLLIYEDTFRSICSNFNLQYYTLRDIKKGDNTINYCDVPYKNNSINQEEKKVDVSNFNPFLLIKPISI